jgi:UDP-N-acetylglucosamine enolpyruvyl transferase
MGIDHTVTIKPVKKMQVKDPTFSIVSDYIEAGTYFTI